MWKFIVTAFCLFVVFAGLSTLMTLASQAPAPEAAPPLAMMRAEAPQPMVRAVIAPAPEGAPTATVREPITTVRHVATAAHRAPAKPACDPFGPAATCEYRDLQGGSGGRVLACSCP